MKWEVNSRADDRVCGAIKKLEWNWVDLVGVELMFGDGGRVRKQWVDPEAMRVQMSVIGRRSEVRVIMRELEL